MADSEIHTSCRIVGEKADYIRKFWDGSIGNYLNNSIKRDIQELENHKKYEKAKLLKEFSIYLVLVAFGMIFFLFSVRSISLLEMYVAFILGLFFTVFGIIGGVSVALQTKTARG